MEREQPSLKLRAMQPDEWGRVASLVHEGTNAWYEAHGRPAVFPGSPASAEIYCQVYERLDPGCCLVAEDEDSGELLGSCFYHPRPTHVSLGIMNCHPQAFGRGVARWLLQWIVDFTEQRGQPLRLVSSAMNLDSFSLYNRVGFVPYAVYQDMTLTVPEAGLGAALPDISRVREARLDDVAAMVALERKHVGIDRTRDFEVLLANEDGIWHTLVREDDRGGLAGFLFSVDHPATHMLGPGVARDDDDATALLAAQLDHYRGRSPVWLVPSERPALIRAAYSFGARNCELHVAQCRGTFMAPSAVVFPTFLPETG